MALYRRKSTSDYAKGALQSVLAGAISTREKLFKVGKVGRPICVACGLEAEDTGHLWWRCPAWAGCREKYRKALFAFQEHWPASSRLCGLMPSAHEAFTHLELDVESDAELADSSEGVMAGGSAWKGTLQLDRWARRTEMIVDGWLLYSPTVLALIIRMRGSGVLELDAFGRAGTCTISPNRWRGPCKRISEPSSRQRSKSCVSSRDLWRFVLTASTSWMACSTT